MVACESESLAGECSTGVLVTEILKSVPAMAKALAKALGAANRQKEGIEKVVDGQAGCGSLVTKVIRRSNTVSLTTIGPGVAISPACGV